MLHKKLRFIEVNNLIFSLLNTIFLAPQFSLLWFQFSNHFQFQIMNVITYASFISIDEKWPKSFPYFIIIHIIQAFQMLVKNAVNHIRNVMQLLSKTEVKLFELVFVLVQALQQFGFELIYQTFEIEIRSP